MSNMTISNLLALLQNSALTQQPVTDTTNSDSLTATTPATTAAGQNLPPDPANTAGASAAEGASSPVMSSDMTAVLLQMQESQEMTDAQALLYGGTSGTNSDSFSYLDGTASSTTDPTQALLDQLTGVSGQQSGAASLMSSNQTLLDYLNAVDANASGTTSTTNGSFSDPSITANQSSANDTAMLDALYSALGSISTAATPADAGTSQNPTVVSPSTTG